MQRGATANNFVCHGASKMRAGMRWALHSLAALASCTAVGYAHRFGPDTAALACISAAAIGHSV